MFPQTMISTEEMRYFQFKAKQLFLLRKENHEWNEFCKRNTCTCCSCQPSTQPKETKEIAVQASPRKPLLASHARNPSSATSDRTLMQALGEVKTRLERIDLALSGKTMEHNINQRFSEMIPPSRMVPVEFSQDPTNEKRIQLIQSSLKQSLQRLQSSGRWKNNARPPLNTKKNSGFFIPHELQKQRTAARNAYLASLTKLKSQPPSSSSGRATKEKNSSKQVKVPQKMPKGVSKTRKESCLKFKRQEREVETAIASDQLHENKKQTSSTMKNTSEETSVKSCFREDLSREKNTEPTTGNNLSNWTKIRQNLPHLKMISEQDRQMSKVDHLNEPEDITGRENAAFQHPSSNKEPEASATSQPPPLPLKKELTIDPKSAQEVSNYRREYMQYLERVSRKKTPNFDPCALANMISESLLNDCIEEVAKELQDVPGFLITDLYDQEFLQTL